MTNNTTEQVRQQVADEQLTERVERGARLLDERRCGWWDEDSGTDLDRLRMDSFTNCVLGQEYGGYETGWEKLADLNDPDWDLKHGFSAWTRDEYDALTAAWRELIEARRAGAR